MEPKHPSTMTYEKYADESINNLLLMIKGREDTIDKLEEEMEKLEQEKNKIQYEYDKLIKEYEILKKKFITASMASKRLGFGI